MFSGQPAGVERVLRVLQSILNPFCEWVRVTEHAPRDLSSVLERLHSLAEIVACGAFVEVERMAADGQQIRFCGASDALSLSSILSQNAGTTTMHTLDHDVSVPDDEPGPRANPPESRLHSDDS